MFYQSLVVVSPDLQALLSEVDRVVTDWLAGHPHIQVLDYRFEFCVADREYIRIVTIVYQLMASIE